jgi:hypothetical protein
MPKAGAPEPSSSESVSTAEKQRAVGQPAARFFCSLLRRGLLFKKLRNLRFQGSCEYEKESNSYPEIINLQPKRSKAKPYQVRQVRAILEKHGLRLADE